MNCFQQQPYDSFIILWQIWKGHLQGRVHLSLHLLAKETSYQILLYPANFLRRLNMWILLKDLVVLHHQHPSVLLRTQLRSLQACHQALRWDLLAQTNRVWTQMLRSGCDEDMCIIFGHAFLLWYLIAHLCQEHWELLFVDQEFKLNPNAKSFTPVTSPLRPPHPPAPDATYYYPNSMPTNPGPGLPVGMGVSFYYI